MSFFISLHKFKFNLLFSSFLPWVHTLVLYLFISTSLYTFLSLLCITVFAFCALFYFEKCFSFFKTSPLTKSHLLFKFFQYMTLSIPGRTLWLIKNLFLSVIASRFINQMYPGWFLSPSLPMFSLFDPNIFSSSTFTVLNTPSLLRDVFQFLSPTYFILEENGVRLPRLTSEPVPSHSMVWYA